MSENPNFKEESNDRSSPESREQEEKLFELQTLLIGRWMNEPELERESDLSREKQENRDDTIERLCQELDFYVPTNQLEAELLLYDKFGRSCKIPEAILLKDHPTIRPGGVINVPRPDGRVESGWTVRIISNSPPYITVTRPTEGGSTAAEYLNIERLASLN